MTTPPLDYAPVHARRRRIGLWVALALSVLLVAAGAWLYRAWEASKQVRAARLAAVAAQLAAIEAAVDAFEVDNGRFPTTAEGLGALVQPPPKLSGWSGPYVKRAVPADPWGTPYAYAASGGFYTVTSAGPDRRLGTPDDVATPAPLTTQPVATARTGGQASAGAAMTPERDPPIPLPAPAPADGARILHADDNAANRYAVSRSLRVAGFEVDEVATGSAALEAVASANPDLLILDVRLPDISGFEVCRRLKADPRTRSVPVLHLTASLVTTRDKVEGLESGADAYLVRPVEPLELIATVRALLRVRRSEEALRLLNQTLERRVAERTAELLAYQQRLRELVGELGRAEQRERRRLAGELHDNLVQLLAVCKMRVSAIRAACAESSDAARHAGAVLGFLDDGIAYARSLMAELGPVVLNDHDLGAAVESLAGRMARHGLRVRVEDDGSPKPLHADVLGLLFQCVRELLFNVVKHAGTPEATVALARAGREVRVTVSDWGSGFDAGSKQVPPSTEGGFGLLSIRERLGLLGGRVEIDSAPGRGTRVAVVVPVEGG